MKEWKDIPGYEGIYQVSNLGDVKSLPRMSFSKGHGGVWRKLKGKLITETLRLDPDGYVKLSLYKEGKRWDTHVHRVVALAFLPNPDNKPDVNHKNGIKTDNRSENLEWNTKSEDAYHKWATGLRGRTNKKKLSPKTEKEIKDEYTQTKTTYKKLAKIYGVSPSYIMRCVKGREWL